MTPDICSKPQEPRIFVLKIGKQKNVKHPFVYLVTGIEETMFPCALYQYLGGVD